MLRQKKNSDFTYSGLLLIPERLNISIVATKVRRSLHSPRVISMSG